ncbi:MAG: inositol monophosphatase family protein [Acidimicrobiales bacterium]|jgi:fructose-1,6-bisphosphatase/inositol monophosphatase family enzyme
MTAPNLGGYHQSDLLELAQEIAEAAGKLLRSRLESVAGGVLLSTGASSKSSPTDLVTEVDKASEALIVSSLLRARPDDGVLGEEGSSRKGSTGVTWVIDPLDGTINYLYGIEEFAVSIGATRDGRSIVGAVHNPMNGEMFAAREGEGASLNGHELQLRPSGRTLAEALVATGFTYVAKDRADQARMLPVVLPAVRDIRRRGSAAIDICGVAAGRFDAFYEAWLRPWDRAAGDVIVREAGATVTDVEGLADGSSTFVVAAPGLEGPLVELLKSAIPS